MINVYTGNPILLQFTFKHRFAFETPDWEYGVRRRVHLRLIPVFIRSHVLISLIIAQPLDRVIARSGETIRLSGDGNRRAGGRGGGEDW